MNNQKLYEFCDLFYHLVKTATKIVKNFGNAVKAYERDKKVKLEPGPAGTMGQIFFIKNDPYKAIKFTTDESEAANMNKLMHWHLQYFYL